MVEDLPLDKKRKKRGTGRRKVKQSGDLLRLDLDAQDSWAYTIRADTILGAVATDLIKYYRQRVMVGRTTDTGDPLPGLVRRGKGERKGGRGYKTGFFADTIRMKDVQGKTNSARVRILPDTRRNVFIAKEAQRGIFYFAVQGDAAQVISNAVNDVLDCELEGRSDRSKTRSRKSRSA